MSEISDDEIKSFMDFEQVLSKRNELVSRKKATTLKVLVSAFLTVSIFSVFYFLILSKSNTTSSTANRNDSLVQAAKIKNSEGNNLALDHKDTLQHQQPSKSAKVEQKIKEKKALSIEPLIDSIKISNEKAITKEYSYQQAEPVKGFQDLYNYFEKELTYPIEALQDSIEGVVTVEFSINISGRPEQIKIENSLGKPFDVEATRVIESMPLWKPAYYNGRPIKSRMSIPLMFHLTKKASK